MAVTGVTGVITATYNCFFGGAHFAGGLGFWEDDGRGILSARETEMMGNTMNRQLGHNNDNFGKVSKVNYYE